MDSEDASSHNIFHCPHKNKNAESYFSSILKNIWVSKLPSQKKAFATSWIQNVFLTISYLHLFPIKCWRFYNLCDFFVLTPLYIEMNVPIISNRRYSITIHYNIRVVIVIADFYSSVSWKNTVQYTFYQGEKKSRSPDGIYSA